VGVVTWATSTSGPAKKRVRLAVAGLAFVLAGVAVSRGARVGPDGGLAAFVPAVDEGADGRDEVFDRGEGAAGSLVW
jgi:hypothetical protein